MSHDENVELYQYIQQLPKETQILAHKCLVDSTAFENAKQLHEDRIISLGVLRRFPHCLEFIKNPTREQSNVAFQARVNSYEFVPDAHKTPQMNLEAVRANHELLAFVPETERTEEVCLAALEINPDYIRYVPQPTFVMMEALLKSTRFQWNHLPEQFRTDPFYTWAHLAFPHQVPFPKDGYTMCPRILAVYTKSDNILYLSETTELEWYIALRQPDLFEKAPIHIRSSELFQKRAVGQQPALLKWCIVPTYAVCMMAVKKRGTTLQYIAEEMQRQHPDLVSEACRDPEAVQWARVFVPDCPATFLYADKDTLYAGIPAPPEHMRKRALEDPETLEPLRSGEIYGCWVDEEGRWFIVGSYSMFLRFLKTGYKGTNLQQIYIPIQRNLVGLKKLKWILW